MTKLMNRRGALGVVAGAACLGASPAWARAPLGGVLRPQRYRAKLGAFEISTVSDGVIQIPGPHPIFGQDQSADAVAALMAENFLPSDKMEVGFTPVVLNTGAEVILFDSGNGAGRRPDAGAVRARLADIDLTPEMVDIVVLTHFHPDHIGGLMEDGAPAYPNARYVANAREFDFWAKDDSPERVRTLAASNVAPLAEKMTMISDGQDVVAGVTAVAAYGHTPGHTVYHLESEGRRLIIAADAVNHYVASLQRPEWHVRFDMDKAAAGASRKKLFDMIAAERIPFTAYHMPFPAVGYVEKADLGYRYAPVAYQLNL